ERVGGVGLVLEADPAVVAAGAQVLGPAVDGQVDRAGLAAPGGVRDLHVRDAVAVRRERLVDVVAVDGQVVHVEQEAEVRLAVVGGDPVDDAHGGGGGPQPGGRRAAHGLD